MFKKDSYPATQTGEIKRTFMFTDPYPTTRIMLDQLVGAPTVAVKVELLGAESLSNFDDPFGPGFQTESKKSTCWVFTVFLLLPRKSRPGIRYNRQLHSHPRRIHLSWWLH